MQLCELSRSGRLVRAYLSDKDDAEYGDLAFMVGNDPNLTLADSIHCMAALNDLRKICKSLREVVIDAVKQNDDFVYEVFRGRKFLRANSAT